VSGVPASSSGARHLGLTIFLAITAALFAAGCGGSGSSSTTEGTGDAEGSRPGGGKVRVVWQEPETEEDEVGYELLEASETEAIVKALAANFDFPRPLTVRGVNGYGEGPYYSGEDNSITLPYGFAAFALEVMAESDPESSEEELGEQAAAVNSFVLGHEFAHALVENLELSVLGKEEDAADSIATALLLEVPGGDEYAADAALFWAELSAGQNSHSLEEYADTHSLNTQRALNILCWVAGSSERAYEEVAEAEVLPASRLETCPSEYELLVDSVEQELEPHLGDEAS
jgi:Putative metallopeptidase